MIKIGVQLFLKNLMNVKKLISIVKIENGHFIKKSLIIYFRTKKNELAKESF